MSNSSIWLKERTLSGASTPGQGEPGSNGNEGILRILQISGIIEDHSWSEPEKNLTNRSENKKTCGVQTEGHGQREKLCCRLISDFIIRLFYFTPRWLVGVTPCPPPKKKNYTKEDSNR